MESKVNFALVGAFVLMLGTLLLGGLLWLSSDKSYRKAYDIYLAYMSESVSGLNLDAPVRYRGVQVGNVRRIALAPDNAELVLLELEIERGTPVMRDTVAVLRVQGLTGIAHVELSGGSRNSPRISLEPGAKYPVIRTGPSLMLRLDNSVTALLANLNRSSESVNLLLGAENLSALHGTLHNLEHLSGVLAKRSDAIDSGLSHASSTLQNTARLTAQANAELPQLLQRIQRSADAFDHMLGVVARTGASASETAESVRADALPEVRQAIAELRELAATLGRFSAALERNPAMLIQGQAGVPGPGE